MSDKEDAKAAVRALGLEPEDEDIDYSIGHTYIRGETRPKDCALVRAVGAVEELNAQIGVILGVSDANQQEQQRIGEILTKLQNLQTRSHDFSSHLNDVVKDIHAAFQSNTAPLPLDQSTIDKLHNIQLHLYEMVGVIKGDKDSFKNLSEIELCDVNNFTNPVADELPCEPLLGSQFYLTLAVCRRAESEVVSVSSEIDKDCIRYLKTLSKVFRKLASTHGYRYEIHKVPTTISW